MERDNSAVLAASGHKRAVCERKAGTRACGPAQAAVARLASSARGACMPPAGD